MDRIMCFNVPRFSSLFLLFFWQYINYFRKLFVFSLFLLFNVDGNIFSFKIIQILYTYIYISLKIIRKVLRKILDQTTLNSA